jgi:CRISPR-associated protein Cas1
MIKRTLYFGNPAYLSLKNEQMVVKLPEVEKSSVSDIIKKESVTTIPIEDIGVVVLDCQQITITQGLMEHLLGNNCAVISCDSHHLPVGLMLPLCGNTTQTERFRNQIDASLPLKKQLWQQTVRAKILNQATVLDYSTNDTHDCMRVWADDVRSGDVDNMEARAAAYYWKNLFPNITDFVRNRDGCKPNNLLNYGYAILRAIIARSLVGSGLLPTLGIFHHNKYNAYCLADDIMEPYRPYVDTIVLDIIDKHGIDTELTKEVKVAFLSIPVIDVVIDGRKSPLMIAASTTTASLAACFAGEQKKIAYPQIQ